MYKVCTVGIKEAFIVTKFIRTNYNKIHIFQLINILYTQAICDWLETHPESLPKARRFAEYYIPTTLKLLHTYNDVQGQQGENAEAIRRDIAGILHTLNQAYDNLYDKLLSDVALDVSSEIAALQGMLANDGLTGEGML